MDVDLIERLISLCKIRYTRKINWDCFHFIITAKLTCKGGRCILMQEGDVINIFIEFSEFILENSTLDQQYTIVAHEIAHGICLYEGTDNGHGPIWKDICIQLGGTGSTFHNLPIKRKLTWQVLHAKEYQTAGLYSRARMQEILRTSSHMYEIIGRVRLDYNEKTYAWVDRTRRADISHCFPTADWKEIP